MEAHEIPSSVTVTANVKRSDFYAVQRLYLARKMWWLPVCWAVIFWSLSRSVFAVVAGVLLGAVIVFLLPLVQWRSAKKTNPNWGKPTIYTFSATGVSLQWPVASVNYEWAAIKRFTESEKYLLIHFPNAFYFIPKRELTEIELHKSRKFFKRIRQPRQD